MTTTLRNRQRGFTLIELMMSAVVFLLVAGAALNLLGITQKRYRTDSQVLTSFQEARLGLDQIVRDVNDSGYPPLNHFSVVPAANLYAVSPLAWSPGYLAGTSCTFGVTCASPGDFDLIVETQFDNTVVQWIRYQLPAGSTTLLRGVVPKAVGVDPLTATGAPNVMLPYVQGVMNNATGAQITAIRAAYPAMFPAGVPVPIFSYTCDVGGGLAPTTCSAAGAFNAPVNVRDVEITLIVQATTNDAQTQRLRLVELHGRGRRINPNQ
jgi:prepilin-type N-terminal cleavage/methylation domain-containing protein